MAVLVGGRISRPKGRGWGVINQELSQVPFERKRRAHGNHPPPNKSLHVFEPPHPKSLNFFEPEHPKSLNFFEPAHPKSLNFFGPTARRDSRALHHRVPFDMLVR